MNFTEDNVRVFQRNSDYRVGEIVLHNSASAREAVSNNPDYAGSVLQEYLSRLSGSGPDFALLKELVIERSGESGRADDFTLVLHIRSGDVACPSQGERVRPDLFIFNVCKIIDSVKRHAKPTTKTVSLMTVMHFGNHEWNSRFMYDPEKVTENIKRLNICGRSLAQVFGKRFFFKMHEDATQPDFKRIDNDLCYLSTSPTVVLDYGAFSDTVKGVRNA